MTVHISERIVEIPFVFANLRVPKASTIVDLGCAESRLSIELANRGFKVLASDLRPYRFEHPNLTILTGNFVAAPVKDASVDAVIAVSTLEHIGLACYGNRSGIDTDRSVVEKIRRVLKPGGQFLLTVPYGVESCTDWYRVYNRQRLDTLLEDFKVEKAEYYRRTGHSSWEETSEQYASQVASPVEANCVALIATVARTCSGEPSSSAPVTS